MFYYEIDFPDSDPSPAVTELVDKKLRKLQQFSDRITSAHVVIRIPHKHSSGRKLFHVHIELEIPGKRFAVSREPEVDDVHADVNVAVRDAFAKLTRQLEDYIRIRKDHHAAETPPTSLP